MERLDVMPFVRGVTAEFAAESAVRGTDVDIQTERRGRRYPC